MGLPYRARVNERWFLNLPGFHGGAYVVAYVEDTRERGLQHCGGCEDESCQRCPYNFEPRMILEIADCTDRITLEFDVDSEAGRANSLHKLDTLLAALRVFREGVVAEFEPTTSGSASSQNSGTESRIERAAASIPAVARGRKHVPLPAMHVGFWPAITRRQSPPSL